MKLLAEYTSDLQEFTAATFDEYRTNKVLRRAVERTLQMAVEACLDIGHHIIAGEGVRAYSEHRRA